MESAKRASKTENVSTATIFPIKPMDKESYSPVSFGRTKRERERRKNEKFTRGWNFFSRSHQSLSIARSSTSNTCDLVAYKFVILV